jgi:transposase-like protein
MSSKAKSKKVDDTKCPQCDSKEHVGFLGGSLCKRYFCSDCCIEFTIKDGKTKVFNITVNGTVE